MAVFSNSRLTPGVHQRLTDADVVALTAEAVLSLNVLTAETVDMFSAIGCCHMRTPLARHGTAPTVAGKSGIEPSRRHKPTTALAEFGDLTIGKSDSDPRWSFPPSAPLPSLASAFARRRQIFGGYNG